MQLKPLATLREIAMVHGLPKLPDDRAARPDRGHVEQPGEAVPFFADKPPEKTLVWEKRMPAPPVPVPPAPSNDEPQAPALAPAVAPTRKKKTIQSRDFKLAAVARVASGKETQEQIARALGLTGASLLSRWARGQGLGKQREKKRMPDKKKTAPRRHHPDEVKLVAIRRAMEGEAPTTVAKQFGITSALLYKWVQRHKAEHGSRLPAVPKTRAAVPVTNGAAPAEGGSALDRLLESKLEKRLDALIETKLVQMLEKKLGG